MDENHRTQQVEPLLVVVVLGGWVKDVVGLEGRQTTTQLADQPPGNVLSSSALMSA